MKKRRKLVRFLCEKFEFWYFLVKKRRKVLRLYWVKLIEFVVHLLSRGLLVCRLLWLLRKVRVRFRR